MQWKRLSAPLSREAATGLIPGDRCLISGTIYSARDKAHQRLVEIMEAGGGLPVELSGQVIYYMGPSPAPPGRVIGAAGPTTSSRMDTFTGKMLEAGVTAMIGKGRRSPEVRKLIEKYEAVYFSSYGGAGAYLAVRIKESEPVAFHDLGPEAVYRLVVEDFPVVVINGPHGGDLYEQAAGFGS